MLLKNGGFLNNEVKCIRRNVIQFVENAQWNKLFLLHFEEKIVVNVVSREIFNIFINKTAFIRIILFSYRYDVLIKKKMFF